MRWVWKMEEKIKARKNHTVIFIPDADQDSIDCLSPASRSCKLFPDASVSSVSGYFYHFYPGSSDYSFNSGPLYGANKQAVPPPRPPAAMASSPSAAEPLWRETPLIYSESISQRLNCHCYLKLEVTRPLATFDSAKPPSLYRTSSSRILSNTEDCLFLLNASMTPKGETRTWSSRREGMQASHWPMPPTV